MNEFLRIVFLVYFITHIPITMMLDFQGLPLAEQFYPQALRNFKDFYTNTYHDYLIDHPPIWFQSFILCEFMFQFPFFFFATYCLWKKKNMIRIPGIIYGTHVATTLVPILAEFLTSPRLRDNERYTLISFYFPYLLIPVMFALHLSFSPFPFPHKMKSK